MATHTPLTILAAAGRHGPALLCGGVVIGLAILLSPSSQSR
jgi:hypothetical protein